MIELLVDGPEDGARVVLAHGAGAAMDSPFLATIASHLAASGVRVYRFEFPYMAARRSGKRRGPDRQPVLLDTFRAVVAQIGAPERLVIGGKSLGGRMASLIADELGVRGLVCLGYPFHPPGKGENLRTEHLATLRTPALIVQGERDPFGTRAEVGSYRLSEAIRVEFMKDGDHSFKPRVSSGTTESDNLRRAAELTAEFIAG
jgi:predicted alpha/beta-hydrolase family hydrolase